MNTKKENPAADPANEVKAEVTETTTPVKEVKIEVTETTAPEVVEKPTEPAATPVAPAAAQPAAPAAPAATQPAGPGLFSRVGKSLTRICRSVGLYKYSVLAKAPMTFVRERGIALLHAVKQDVRETRAQGRDYVHHVKSVIKARNRLKEQAWNDAKSALNRWEILAKRAAASISDAPEGTESEVTQAVMMELATIVEVEFRAIVPEDVSVMTDELTKLLRKNDSETAIRSIIEDMISQRESKRVSTMRMAGSSGDLDRDIDAMQKNTAAPACA